MGKIGGEISFNLMNYSVFNIYTVCIDVLKMVGKYCNVMR